MKIKMLMAVTMAVFMYQSAFALTAREIIDKSDALPEPDKAKTSVTMYVYKSGSKVKKEFTAIALNTKRDQDKALISFTSPTQIKLLTHQKKGGDDDQWLRLSSGKVKRIAASDRDKSFVGSHFYYEDLKSRVKNDYDYTSVGEGTEDGDVCYKIKAVKKKGTKVYDHTILWVRKSDYFVKRIDIFKKGNTMHKFLVNYSVKKIKGILTPHKSVMYFGDKKGDNKTELIVNDVQYYDKGSNKVTESMFNQSALR